MCRAERLAIALLPLVLTACGGREPETDVAPAIDVVPAIDVDTANDPRAGEEAPALTGVLPADFPADLPIYVPASLIDFGRSPRGLRSVSLLSPHAASRVRPELDDLMRDRGWAGGGSPGEEGGTRWRKGAQEVWLRVEDARPGTLYVFEY